MEWWYVNIRSIICRPEMMSFYEVTGNYFKATRCISTRIYYATPAARRYGRKLMLIKRDLVAWRPLVFLNMVVMIYYQYNNFMYSWTLWHESCTTKMLIKVWFLFDISWWAFLMKMVFVDACFLCGLDIYYTVALYFPLIDTCYCASNNIILHIF